MTERPELTFDGCGINGPDEYRSRVATFQNHDLAAQYGPMFAAAPALLEALAECITDDGAVGMRNIEYARKRLRFINEIARRAIESGRPAEARSIPSS